MTHYSIIMYFIIWGLNLATGYLHRGVMDTPSAANSLHYHHVYKCCIFIRNGKWLLADLHQANYKQGSVTTSYISLICSKRWHMSTNHSSMIWIGWSRLLIAKLNWKLFAMKYICGTPKIMVVKLLCVPRNQIQNINPNTSYSRKHHLRLPTRKFLAS